MDGVEIRHSWRGLLFEWDKDKAARNLKKHGVSFETACEVFFDPLVLLRDAGDEDTGALAAIGETSNERLLLVVHVLKEEERIRVISARPVNAHERREYES
jgi:uncharacterized DUF497 family protein